MSSLAARRTAVLSKGAGKGSTSPVFAKGNDDPSKTLDQLFNASAGRAMAYCKRRGPVLTYSGNGGTSMIWDENGVLVSTTNNEPRFDHDPVTGAALGLLIEEARENEIIQSEAFATSWTPVSGIEIDSNSTVAPDGNTTADTLEDDEAGAFSTVRSVSITVSNNDTYAASVFIKKDSTGGATRFPMLRLRFSGGSASDLEIGMETSTGSTVEDKSGSGTIVDSGVVDVGDYWRFYIVGKNDASGNTALLLELFPAAGANADLTTLSAGALGSIIAWGAQLEEASFISSYVPTTTASVTRTKDVCATSDISWFNEGQPGTFFVNNSYPPGAVGSTSDGYMFSLDDGSTSNIYRARFRPGTPRVVYDANIGTGNDSSITLTGSWTANTSHKTAWGLANDDVALSEDGSAVGTDSTADLPTGMTQPFRLGADTSAQNEPNGHIAQIKYWNVRKSNGFLENITTPF